MKRTIRLTALTAIAAGALALPAVADGQSSKTLSPTSLSFGSQPAGATSAPQSTKLTFSCNADVTCLVVGETFIPSISVTPSSFAQTNNCTQMNLNVVFPSKNCTINVSFTPAAGVDFAGTLSTGTGGPTAALSGTGLAPAPALGTGGKAGKCKKGKGAATAKRKKKGCKKRKKKGGK